MFSGLSHLVVHIHLYWIQNSLFFLRLCLVVLFMHILMNKPLWQIGFCPRGFLNTIGGLHKGEITIYLVLRYFILVEVIQNWNLYRAYFKYKNDGFSVTCKSLKYEIFTQIIHWNSPKKYNVDNRDGDYFRNVAMGFMEYNGNLFRKKLQYCNGSLIPLVVSHIN